MSTDRQRKIELLVRKNQAGSEHPYYLTELSHILKQKMGQDDLLDLETTDNLFSQYARGARRDDPEWALKNVWPSEPSSRWIRVCFCLAERLGAEEVALFAGPYSTCGAIRTKAEYPLVNASSILTFDRDTLRLQSFGSGSGLYLDLHEEDAAWWIELKVWGDWCSSARECLAQVAESSR